MRATRTQRESIRAWLQEWAKWRHVANPYPDSTTVFRAMREGALGDGGSFGSSPPKGVIPWRSIERLHYAMQRVAEKKPGPIAAVRYFYELQGREPAIKAYGKPARTFDRHKQIGEDAIIDFFRVY